MSNNLRLPAFAHDVLGPCKRCGEFIGAAEVIAIGLENVRGNWYASARTRCSNCQKKQSSTLLSHRLSARRWADQLAESVATAAGIPKKGRKKRPVRRDQKNRKPNRQSTDEQGSPPDANAPPEYLTSHVDVLAIAPANFDDARGEPVVVVTVARNDEIEPLSMRLRDAKMVVTGLLVAVATSEDAFAARLLDGHFDANSDGQYIWPRECP